MGHVSTLSVYKWASPLEAASCLQVLKMLIWLALPVTNNVRPPCVPPLSSAHTMDPRLTRAKPGRDPILKLLNGDWLFISRQRANNSLCREAALPALISASASRSARVARSSQIGIAGLWNNHRTHPFGDQLERLGTVSERPQTCLWISSPETRRGKFRQDGMAQAPSSSAASGTSRCAARRWAPEQVNWKLALLDDVRLSWAICRSIVGSSGVLHGQIQGEKEEACKQAFMARRWVEQGRQNPPPRLLGFTQPDGTLPG
jgi:hypothetical protein